MPLQITMKCRRRTRLIRVEACLVSPLRRQDALVGKERIGRLMLLGVWTREAARREPERRLLYAARALAYLQAGNAAQALEARLNQLRHRRQTALNRRKSWLTTVHMACACPQQDARQAVAQGGGAASGSPAAAAQGSVGALSHALFARSLLASHVVRATIMPSILPPPRIHVGLTRVPSAPAAPRQETEALSDTAKGRDFAAPALSVAAMHLRLAVDSATAAAAAEAAQQPRRTSPAGDTAGGDALARSSRSSSAAAAGDQEQHAACATAAVASSSSVGAADVVMMSTSACAAAADDAEWYREELEALVGRLLPAHAKALAGGGASGLFARLAEEAQAQLPEFMQPRPKYYHFFNWMRERITLALGAAPEEVQCGGGRARRFFLARQQQLNNCSRGGTIDPACCPVHHHRRKSWTSCSRWTQGSWCERRVSHE